MGKKVETERVESSLNPNRHPEEFGEMLRVIAKLINPLGYNVVTEFDNQKVIFWLEEIK